MFGVFENYGICNIINIVMMGMGELLLNFENVVMVMEIMKDDFGYGVVKK